MKLRFLPSLAVAFSLFAAVFFHGEAHAQAVPCVGPVQGNCVPVVQFQGAAGTAGYPTGAVPQSVAGAGTTGTASATLVGVAGKFTYICGFAITANATAATSGNANSAGLTGNLSYLQGVAALPAVATLQQTFSPCLPSSALAGNISMTSATAGSGGNTLVDVWGYTL